MNIEQLFSLFVYSGEDGLEGYLETKTISIRVPALN